MFFLFVLHFNALIIEFASSWKNYILYIHIRIVRDFSLWYIRMKEKTTNFFFFPFSFSLFINPFSHLPFSSPFLLEALFLSLIQFLSLLPPFSRSLSSSPSLHLSFSLPLPSSSALLAILFFIFLLSLDLPYLLLSSVYLYFEPSAKEVSSWRVGVFTSMIGWEILSEQNQIG